MSTALFQGRGGGSIAPYARLDHRPTREEVIERFKSAPFDCSGRAPDDAWILSVHILPDGDDNWMTLMKPSGTVELTHVEVDDREGDCDAVVTGVFACKLTKGADDVRVTGAFRGRFGLPE